MRQPVLFGSSVAERARETGVSEYTLGRRIRALRGRRDRGPVRYREGQKAKAPADSRRLIVDLKAEYPPFNLNEIANIVARLLRQKARHAFRKAALDEELPLKLERS